MISLCIGHTRLTIDYLMLRNYQQLKSSNVESRNQRLIVKSYLGSDYIKRIAIKSTISTVTFRCYWKKILNKEN